jgi:hypothetical protein
MMRFFLVSVTGWAAVLGTGIEAALPYIFRNTLRNPPPSAGGLPERMPNLRAKMWPHYWLGYALLALVLAHTSFVMGPVMGRTDATGIWAATLALCLLFLQVSVGLILKSGTNIRSSNQRSIRRWHFWTMLGFIGLVLIHLLRNG